MTVLESAATGTPVVSTAVGRVGETFNADADYWCVEPDDVTGTADAIECIFRDVGSGVADRVRSASERVAADFSERGFVEKMSGIYAEVADRSGASHEVSHREGDQRRSDTLRRWRAVDRAYWAKELFVAGQRKRAVGMIVDAFRLDPLCEGIWRIPARKLGFMKDEK